MMTYGDNKITSLMEQMKYEQVGKAFLNQTAKPLLEVLENGDYTIDLENEGYKRFINIRMDNIIKRFDQDGNLDVEHKYYPVEKCTIDNFKRNEFEETYWQYT